MIHADYKARDLRSYRGEWDVLRLVAVRVLQIAAGVAVVAVLMMVW